MPLFWTGRPLEIPYKSLTLIRNVVISLDKYEIREKDDLGMENVLFTPSKQLSQLSDRHT